MTQWKLMCGILNHIAWLVFRTNYKDISIVHLGMWHYILQCICCPWFNCDAKILFCENIHAKSQLFSIVLILKFFLCDSKV